MMDRTRELVPDNWSLVRENRWPLDFVWKDGILNTWVSGLSVEGSILIERLGGGGSMRESSEVGKMAGGEGVKGGGARDSKGESLRVLVIH